MTVDATTHDDGTEPSGEAPDDGTAAPGPMPPAAAPAVQLVAIRPPRAGELTPRWRLVTAGVWVAVAVAIGAVWKSTDQLGMSTWWTGPRGEPRPVAVQLLPFLPAVVMVLLAANRIRFLAWCGAVCSALVIATGVADLSFFRASGLAEIAIGCAALLVSAASTTGAYRPGPAPDDAGDAPEP